MWTLLPEDCLQKRVGNMYEIDIEAFQGPLDVLLGLISKQKVRIEDVSISSITDGYMDYLEQMQQMDMEVTTEFIVMASMLLFIKSRSMLPKPSEDEEQGDPEEELRRRLIEYKMIKEATLLLQERENEFSGIYSKLPEEYEYDVSETEFKTLGMHKLAEAFGNILAKKPFLQVEDNTIKLKRDPMTITQAMDYIKFCLADSPNILFENIFEKYNTKKDIITLFTGMLELLKENVISVYQECAYAPITVLRGSSWTNENKSE